MKIALNHDPRPASRTLRLLGAVLIAGLATGCARPGSMAPGADEPALAAERRAQKVLLAREIGRDRDRVFRTGYPILASAAAQCPETPALETGLDLARLAALTPEAREAAEQLTQTSLRDAPASGLLALGVAPGSPAAQAGLRPGDVITAAFDAGGAPLDLATAAAPGLEFDQAFGLPGIAASRVERWRAPAVAARLQAETEAETRTENQNPTQTQTQAEAAASLASAAPPADPRAGQIRASVALTPRPVCPFAFALSSGAGLNAFADGERMIFTRDMLRFAVGDVELATVIAHEVAHNQRGHLDAKRTNAAIGAIGGGVLDIAAILVGVNTGGAFSKALGDAGAGAYSQSFETEADYVGMYLLRGAGFDTAEAPDIWRRMAAAGSGAQIAHATSHPTTPERFITLTRTHEEILAKVAAGEPLVPNEDEALWAPEPTDAAPRADSALR